LYRYILVFVVKFLLGEVDLSGGLSMANLSGAQVPLTGQANAVHLTGQTHPSLYIAYIVVNLTLHNFDV
jgi:hypothetical protein